MQPEIRAEAEDWMRRAVRDLLAAERMIDGSDPLLEVAAFHAQQSVEKALKAFLTIHQQLFAKTHDLDLLLRQCISVDRGFARFLPAAIDMTPYAVRFRYPGGPLEPSLVEVQEALRIAHEIIGIVSSRLGLEN